MFVGVQIGHRKALNRALYIAVSRGHVDVVRVLVNAGTSVTLANEAGVTPVHIAVDKYVICPQ